LTLFSYVVARDYGFAPNPFFGTCTLATCKPNIRKAAQVGDWVIGTGSASRKRSGTLVFAMQVSTAMTFNEYWDDERFRRKKPNLSGSKKQAFGDNIYFRESSGLWNQIDSHHSYPGGQPNIHNIRNDTQIDRVLASTNFCYWGGAGPKIPQSMRSFEGFDVCAGRGHKCKFPSELVEIFLNWLNGLEVSGFQAAPLDWQRS
jgi:putative DNA base modification enzyme with NMAD domain